MVGKKPLDHGEIHLVRLRSNETRPMRNHIIAKHEWPLLFPVVLRPCWKPSGTWWILHVLSLIGCMTFSLDMTIPERLTTAGWCYLSLCKCYVCSWSALIRRPHSATCFSCVNRRQVGILIVCFERKLIALANHIRCKHLIEPIRTPD